MPTGEARWLSSEIAFTALDLHQSIVDYGRVDPSSDPIFGAGSGWYWSSSTYVFGPDSAWLVGFNVGCVDYGDKDDGFFVRAVRG